METLAEVNVAPALSGWRRGEPVDAMLAREWLVTNGLGGYASGTISGTVTRRYHGLLVAALPVPFGRTVMLNHLEECVVAETAAGERRRNRERKKRTHGNSLR